MLILWEFHNGIHNGLLISKRIIDYNFGNISPAQLGISQFVTRPITECTKIKVWSRVLVCVIRVCL